MRISKLLLILGLTLSAASCKKEDENETYHGKIHNSLSQPVQLDFYATREDYNNNVNIVKSAVVPARGDFEIPAEFVGGSNMYLDWYTSDYQSSNWGLDPKMNIPNVPEDFGPVYNISVTNFSTARIFWLGGNKPSTRWRAFDYRSSFFPYYSYWQTQLQPYQREKEIVIRKNQTGTFTYKNAAGSTYNMDFSFSVSSGGGNNGIFVMLTNGSTYFLSASELPTGTGYAQDTMMTPYSFPPFEQSSSSINFFYYRVP